MARGSDAMLVSMLAACTALLAARQFSRPSVCDPDNGGLTLIAGFCATVVADNLVLRVTSPRLQNGDLYVELHDDKAPGGSVIALRDTDGDGRFDQQQHFGAGLGGSAIAWRTQPAVRRSRHENRAVPDWTASPSSRSDLLRSSSTVFQMQAITRQSIRLRRTRGESTCTLARQATTVRPGDRVAGAPRTAPVLRSRTRCGASGSTQADRVGQAHSASNRFATGIRHTVGVAWNTTTHSLWAVQNGRDQLNLWPAFDTVRNAELPAEELQEIEHGADYGWPYCYFDPVQNKRVETPEYGGDGRADAIARNTRSRSRRSPPTTRRSICSSTPAPSFRRNIRTASSSHSMDRGTVRRCRRPDTT
jgi:hypothetical protein